MFAEKHIPTTITGIELDRYLNNGWYRMGQIIFTTHFLFYENVLYSPIWIRLPLKDYKFRKSLRKIKNNVEKQFRIEIRDGEIDPYKEGLYNRYAQKFNGFIAPTLTAGLMDSSPFNIFNSKTIEVFEGKKLVAFSFFDIGKESLASIQGVYHPAYSKYSLGFYTMIKEIEYGMENGFEYYYPGYIVPGLNRFDYKLRVGKKEEVEFYNLYSRSWKKYGFFKEENVPVNIVNKKLSELGWLLSKENIACQMLYFAAYEEPIFGPKKNRVLDSPLFVSLFQDIFRQPKFMVYYDIWKEKFVMVHVLTEEELPNYFEFSFQYDRRSIRQFIDYLSHHSKIIETADLKEIAAVCKSLVSILVK